MASIPDLAPQAHPTGFPARPHIIGSVWKCEKDSVLILPTGLKIKAETVPRRCPEFLDEKNCGEQCGVIIMIMLTTSLEI